MGVMSSTELFSDKESLPSCSGNKSKYGYIVVDGEWHEITIGETKIGRDASICSIVLPDATLSLLHAVIESEGPEDSFIYDANSSNKTKIGKMTLKPKCRYKINDNDTVILGRKIVHYKVTDHKVENCKTESSFNICKLSKSERKTANINTVTYTNIENAFDTDGKLVFNSREQAKNHHTLKESLFVPEKISNKPKKSHYILASELFNTNIFSQATQCEVEKEEIKSFKSGNKESVHCDNDVLSMKTQCDQLAGSNKIESKSKCCEGSNKNINQITETYLDDSGTFDFVRKSEMKHFLSSSICKSISDDIFEIPTQGQPKIILSDKDENFKNCFSSKLFSSQKSEAGFVSTTKIELEKDSCKTNIEDPGRSLNSGDVDSSFFDEDDDEELCEIMRALSPGDNLNYDCILKPGKKPMGNNELREFNDPDEIFEVQTQYGLSNINNFNQSKNETLDSKYNEKEEFKLSPTNEKGKGFTKIEEAQKNSVGAYSLMTQKVTVRETKSISKEKLKKEVVEITNKRGMNANSNISKLCVKDKKMSNRESTKNACANTSSKYLLNSGDALNDSPNAFQKGQCIVPGCVLTDEVISEMLNGESDFDSEIRFCGGDSGKNGEVIKSPVVNETLNEVWENLSNCSPVSSNRTLSDLDISEFQVNRITCSGSDSEGDFICTQGSYLVDKLNSKDLNGKCETETKKTKSKLDIWKESWQDCLFTQNVSDEKRKKSEYESTDKTESDIVVSTKPIPNIGHYEIHETSSEDVFDIEENTNESECVMKKNIEDDTSSSGDIGGEFKCESPALLESNIQTDNIRDEEDRNLIKSAEENSNKEYEPNDIGVVSDSDETDCEKELKTRKLSFFHKVSDSNREGEGVFPSTSDLTMRRENCGKMKKIAKENILLEKLDDSPLKRTRKSDADVVLPKKRSKNVRKKKESDDVCGRQLRSRSVKASGERVELENSKRNHEVKGRSRKRVTNTNTNIASRKKLEFVVKKSSEENDTSEGSFSGSQRQPSSVKILFTGFESESHNRIISKLGGLRVNDFDDGNVLVTDKVRRTVKFLSAVALGLPIVSPKWLLSSNKELKFLNPWDFLLEDEDSEERWGFNLKTSLENWRRDKLLKGFNVFATNNTKPPVPEILSIVKCCGGMTFTSYPEIWPEKSIVLTCLEDKKSWPHHRYRNVKILHYEFLLSGVLKHEMDFKKYNLR